MGIYINMEIPDKCGSCRFATAFDSFDCDVDGKFIHTYDVRRKDCPLVAVPAHGDLISREWLIDIALHLMNTAKNDDIANGVKWLWQYIIDAPTIIPADALKHPKSNADRIRTMSDEELAEFLDLVRGNKDYPLYYTDWIDWLKEEAKDV